MKRFLPALLILMTACTAAPSEPQIQTAIAQTQSSAPAATQAQGPAPTQQPATNNQGVSEFTGVATGEDYSLRITVTRLAIGTSEAMLPETAAIISDWSQASREKQAAYWMQFRTLGTVEIKAENTGKDTLKFSLYMGSLVINGEQINPFQSSLDAYIYLNNFSELLPGAHSTMGIYFGLNDTEWSPGFNLDSFAYKVDLRNEDGTKLGEVLVQK